MQLLNRLLNVPAMDPEDARRRRLLNILLLGIAVLMLVMILVTLIANLTNILAPEYVGVLLRGNLIGLSGIAIIYLINRFWSGWVASSLFLLLLIFISALSDDPEQVVDGRTLFVFAIPILMASVLLRPYASFIVAGFVSLLLIVISVLEQIVPNLIATIGFFAIALVSWLSARSLEDALEDVRQTNLELDQRVDERTRDLAEALAREHAEGNRNEAVLEGIADGVIVFDEEGLAIVVNPAIGQIMSMSAVEILGCDIKTLIGEDVSDEDLEVLRSLLMGQELHRTSVKFEWGEKTLSASFAPVRSTPGQMAGTVAVFRDFTREAEIERMKSDFVSTVSHELRTPLTSIKGYLDLVLMGASGPINKQQESFLQIVKSNADRLHVLVSDLLDLSRIESGRVELDIQVVSLPAVVDQVVSSLRKEFEDRGLSLAVDVPAELPEILADPDRIAQALTNLVSNAYKYTRDGGATVRARVGMGALQIEVSDTGIGISVQEQMQLFTPFFRAENAVVREQVGTGLGLSITKLLVDMHGGDIWVDSRPGEGSTFSFTLPLPGGLAGAAPPLVESELGVTSKPTPVPEAESRYSVLAGPRILVADDDTEVAHLFQRQLEREGYRVTVVARGGQVVQVARHLRPDLITLDLMMDVDGLSVLTKLKAEPATADIPVVIISVIPEPERGFGMGAADYLVKPIEEGDLEDCVRRVLGQASSGTRRKILVVDDEVDIVGWLRHFLSHSGYEVMDAYDGIQALEAVAAERPDLILLDMKMPRMDGRTTLRRLRAQEDTRHIPVIVLSAHVVGDEKERAQLLDMGVRELLRKPVTMERLVAEIEKYLGTT